MKRLFFLIPVAGLLVLLLVFRLQAEKSDLLSGPQPSLPGNFSGDGPKHPKPEILAQKIAEASAFCQAKGLNAEVAILVDLGLHSGSYRCFVVRLTDGSIRLKGLVTHGSGKTGLLAGERLYSNKEGSLLSALGKYKTGLAYTGQFGLAFKLHGLDSSNSNAYKRAIVLHGHECVPDAETDSPICQSWGCPTVSPAFLVQLKKVIDSGKKPMLVWVYDGAMEPVK